MKILIHGKNLELTGALKEYTEAKIEKATLHYKDIVKEADIHLSIEKNPSSRLAGNDLIIIFKTGSWVLRDWPKSKCNIFLIYEKY